MNYFIPHNRSLDSITIPIGMVINGPPVVDLIEAKLDELLSPGDTYLLNVRSEHIKDDDNVSH